MKNISVSNDIMKLKYIFSFLFLFLSTCYPQNYYTLKGHISDDINGEKIAGAEIILQDLNLSVRADIEGNFVINNIPAGKQVVIYGSLFYLTQTDTILFNSNNKIISVSIALKREGGRIVRVPEIEKYQLKLLESAQKNSLLKIHIDSLNYNDGQVTISSTFINLSKDTIYVIKECPCFRVINGIVYRGSDSVKSNILSLDCDVMPYRLINKNDLIEIKPGDSIKYPAADLIYYAFNNLPAGEYRIGIKYKFAGPWLLTGIFSPPKDDAILIALRGEYSSDNFLTFKK